MPDAGAANAGGWDEDWAAVWRDTGAGQPLPAGDPLSAKRAEVDQAVLANLLRLNHERAGAGAAVPLEADTEPEEGAEDEKPVKAAGGKRKGKGK